MSCCAVVRYGQEEAAGTSQYEIEVQQLKQRESMRQEKALQRSSIGRGAWRKLKSAVFVRCEGAPGLAVRMRVVGACCLSPHRGLCAWCALGVGGAEAQP